MEYLKYGEAKTRLVSSGVGVECCCGLMLMMTHTSMTSAAKPRLGEGMRMQERVMIGGLAVSLLVLGVVFYGF